MKLKPLIYKYYYNMSDETRRLRNASYYENIKERLKKLNMNKYYENNNIILGRKQQRYHAKKQIDI
jgi:hypothetical protein